MVYEKSQLRQEGEAKLKITLRAHPHLKDELDFWADKLGIPANQLALRFLADGVIKLNQGCYRLTPIKEKLETMAA